MLRAAEGSSSTSRSALTSSGAATLCNGMNGSLCMYVCMCSSWLRIDGSPSIPIPYRPHPFPRHRSPYRAEARLYGIGMDGEPSISNHDEHIHTYIHKDPYIPLYRVAAPDEVRADHDIEEGSFAARNILRWPRIPSLP